MLDVVPLPILTYRLCSLRMRRHIVGPSLLENGERPLICPTLSAGKMRAIDWVEDPESDCTHSQWHAETIAC